MVVVQVVVDVEGKPKKVSIMKSDDEIFNAPTLEAAKNMLFTPALDKNQKPVEASVAIPFKYALDNKDKAADTKKSDAKKSTAIKTK